MIAVDSSIAIAGFASWHEQHETARKVLARSPRLVAHAALETYSVLTRLPPPHRAPADLVEAFLTSRFPDHLLCPPDNQHRELIALLAQRQILGGRVYDALIGMTAAAHGATLISLDRRAVFVYETVGVSVELLG